jgi:hypothetical protein
MSTDAHLETPSCDYSIEVECRAAELDAETVSSLQDLFNRMSTDMARPGEPSSALTLYRARANESRSEPPVGSALEWLEAAIPDLSVRSIYINLDKRTLSKADDFLHGLTFTYRQTTLAERIRDLPVPLFGSMPSGLQTFESLLGRAPILAVSGELTAAGYPLTAAIFTGGAAFLLYLAGPMLETTTEAQLKWWRRKLGLDPTQPSPTASERPDPSTAG